MKMRALITTSTIKIAVLHGADILNAYAIWTFMTYFTDVWLFSLAKAAAIVNLLDAGTNILSIGLLFLARKYTGYYPMFMLSIVASTMGLGLLSLSSLFYEADHKVCKDKCRRILACIGLVVFLAVGRSGFLASYEELVAELKPLIKHKRRNKGDIMALENADINTLLALEKQTEDEDPNKMVKNKEEKKANMLSKMMKTNRQKITKTLKACVIVFILPFMVSFIMHFIKPWSANFGIPTIYNLLATLIFLFGTYKYKYPNAPTSPLAVFRVIMAFVSNIFYRWPATYATQLFEYERYDNWLPRMVSIIIRLLYYEGVTSSQTQTPLPQQNNSRWESVVQALKSKTFKKLLLVIPMCITFIILRVTSSVGDTYFNDQATSMEAKIFEDIIIPFYLYEIANVIFTLLYFKMANCFALDGEKSKLYVSLTGIAISMVLAIPCCIVAAKVESKRLTVAERHWLMKPTNKKVPMNVVWVVPQYLLLAGLDGISSECITLFFEDQLSFTQRIAKHIEHALSGLGCLVNVLLVFLLDQISERDGRNSWFQDSINLSRLDKYFWVLFEIAAANILLFFMLAIWYVYKARISDIHKQ